MTATQETSPETPETPSAPPAHRRLWAELGLWVLGAVILFLYSGIWRPIWFDEFLHFAMGGMTWEYALKTVDYTTIEVNHGQTGVYMLLDWLLLQAFGASAVALRLPSLLAAALLLAAAVTFLRRRGFGYGWQYLVLLALAAHTALIWFTGEARPYMPLAAAGVAVLAYYQYDASSRRRPWPLILGIAGVCGGALLHPYIVYVIALLVPFSIWVAIRGGRLAWQVRDVVRFANPILLGVGAVMFLIVGQLTWMRRVLSFDYDPLAQMGNSWAYTIDRGVVDHFANETTSWQWVAGLALLTLVCLAVARFRCSRDILPPLVLILLALATSVTVSGLSALRTYWILERQWVAGIALVTVGCVWFFAELLKAASRDRSRILEVPVYAFIALTTVSAAFTLVNQVQTTNDRRVAYEEFVREVRTMDELRPAQINDDTAYIYAANVNVARGGPVWTMFVDWYDNLSGMRPEFRESNPSWTGFLGDSRTQG